MSRGVRIIARSALLLAGVLVSALLLATAVVRLPPIQRWVAQRVSALLPAGISVEGVTPTVAPPGVRLANVTLGTDAVVLGSVSCRLHIPALLAGRIEVSEVVVDSVTVNVDRTADGSITVGSTVLIGTPPAHTSLLPMSLAAVPQLRLTDGTLTFTDQTARDGPRALRLIGGQLTVGPATASGLPVTLSARGDPTGELIAQGSIRQITASDGAPDYAIEANATATGLDAQTVVSYLAAIVPGGGAAHAGGTLNGSLNLAGTRATGLSGVATLTQSSGSVTWDEAVFTAPIGLSVHVATAPDGLALSDGQLTIAQLAADRVGASDLNAAFAYSGRVLHLTSVRATAYGGTWTQSGTVVLTEPPNFDVTLRADGVSCDALLTAVTGAHPDYGCEQFSAQAALLGEWRGAQSIARTAEGTGHLEMRGGTIPSSSILGAVWDALVPLIKIGSTPRVAGAPTQVEHLTESFALEVGRLHTTDLSVVANDYTITGTGSMGLDGSLDLNTEIAMTPEGVTKMLTMAALPIPGDPGSLPSIPTRITGTLGHPDIRPEASDVPRAAMQSVLRGARGAADVLQDAAGEGLRGLKWGVDRVW